MKFWMRAATVTSIVWLIGWYSVHGQTLMEKLVTERQQMEFDKSDQIEQKSCDDWHNGKSQVDKSGFDPDRFICENRNRNRHQVTDPTLLRILNNQHPAFAVTDYLQFAKSQIGFVVASLLVIWGSFAMLQWLIRGRLL
jgi:hypothetical protein